jgi:hypothetical protein
LGWVFQKIRNWKGFIVGTTTGLFFGNLFAAAGVVFLLGLPSALIVGFLLFWFGTMFPFVIIFVPFLVRAMRPYASKLAGSRGYPEISEPNPKVLWGLSISVAGFVLAALLVALFSASSFVTTHGGALFWEALFVVSAASVILVSATLPSRQHKLARSQARLSRAKFD